MNGVLGSATGSLRLSVLKAGWNITYVPNIKVKHFHRDSWLELYYQHYMYGRSYYLIRYKWKEMYSIYPHKINSFKKVVKYISSWTYTPLMDAYIKSKNLNEMRLLVIIVIFFINLSNRAGIFAQKNFYEKNK